MFQVCGCPPPVSWWWVENLSAGLKAAVCFLMTPSSTGRSMKVRNGHRTVFGYHADFWMTLLRLNCTSLLELSFPLELPDAASQLLPGFHLTPVPGNIYLIFHFCAKENLLNRILQGFLFLFFFLSCRHLRRRPQGGLHGGPLAPQRGRGRATGLGLHFHSSPFGGQRREIGVRRPWQHFLPPDRRCSRCVDNIIWPRPKMF